MPLTTCASICIASVIRTRPEGQKDLAAGCVAIWRRNRVPHVFLLFMRYSAVSRDTASDMNNPATTFE